MLKILLTLLLAQSIRLMHPSYSLKIPLIKKIIANAKQKNTLSSLRSSKYPSFISSQNTITLSDYSNQQYIGQIALGTPPQYLSIIFDTGSGNFFINSNLCTASTCLSRPSYDHSKSSTYEDLDMSLQVSFGSGTVSGLLISDTLTMGALVIPDQDVAEVITEVGSVFYDAEFSGIMGLAFNTLAHEGTVPVFDNIVNGGELDWNVISFYFCLDESQDSEMVIGDVNEDKFVGDLNWVDVTPDPYYWTVVITDVRVGKVSTGLCKNGCKAAIDTGTTLMLMPSKDLSVLHNYLPEGCNYEDMDDVIYVIGGVEYSIPAKSYVVTSKDGIEEDPGVHSAGATNDCSTAFLPLDIDEPFGPVWVFGNIFMDSYYVAFDRDSMQVGFAKSINYRNS